MGEQARGRHDHFPNSRAVSETTARPEWPGHGRQFSRAAHQSGRISHERGFEQPQEMIDVLPASLKQWSRSARRGGLHIGGASGGNSI